MALSNLVMICVFSVLWHVEYQKLHPIYFHNIPKKADTFTADDSKNLQLTLKQSGWINSTSGKMKNMYFVLGVNNPFNIDFSNCTKLSSTHLPTVSRSELLLTYMKTEPSFRATCFEQTALQNLLQSVSQF